jgi:hypothetical protein
MYEALLSQQKLGSGAIFWGSMWQIYVDMLATSVIISSQAWNKITVVMVIDFSTRNVCNKMYAFWVVLWTPRVSLWNSSVCSMRCYCWCIKICVLICFMFAVKILVRYFTTKATWNICKPGVRKEFVIMRWHFPAIRLCFVNNTILQCSHAINSKW